MTNSEVWGAIAILALAGWGWSNFTLQRAFVPIANAFNILEKLMTRQDDQIQKTVERILQRSGGILPKPMTSAPQQSRNPDVEAINQVFGANALEPITEQPDAGESSVDIIE